MREIQHEIKGQGALKTPWPRWGFWTKVLLVAALYYENWDFPFDWLSDALVYQPLAPLVGPHRAYFCWQLAGDFGGLAVIVAVVLWGLSLFKLTLADLGIKKPTRTFPAWILAAALLAFLDQRCYQAVMIARDGLPGGLAFWAPHWRAPAAIFSDPVAFNHGLTDWLVGSIAEELFNRGLLFAALRPRLGAAKTIVLTAAFFCLAHFAAVNFVFWRMHWFGATYTPSVTSWIGSVEIFASGLILGGLREGSGELWTPLAAHWLMDFLALYMG